MRSLVSPPRFATGFAQLGFAILFFIFCQSIDLSGQTKIAEIESEENTCAWAVHEASGRIFSANWSTNEVVEYDVNGNEIRRLKVDGEPSYLMIKRDRLVVGCPGDHSFSVIDLNENKVTGKIELEGNGPYAPFCSQADNPFAYAISYDKTRSSSTQVIQVDLEKMAVTARTTTSDWGDRDPANITMSPDGKWIVVDSRGRSSPSGADLMRVSESPLKFTQVHDYHKSFGQTGVDPLNQFWILGDKIYSRDLRNVRHVMSAPIQAIHPKYDLVACYFAGRIFFQKISDGRLITKVTVSDSIKSPPKPPRAVVLRNRNTCLQFDLKKNHLVIGDQNRCYVVDLVENEVTLNPRFTITTQSTIDIALGKTLELSPSITNAEHFPDVKFSLDSAPDGMRLEGGKLIWTPQPNQVGRQKFNLIATHGEQTTKLPIAADVHSPRISVGFAIKGMSLNEKTMRAIVWGKKVDPQARSYVDRNAGPDEVAIIDLKTGKTLIQKTFTAGVRSAQLESGYAFILPQAGNVIYRYSQETLDDSKRKFLSSPAGGFIPFIDGMVALATGFSAVNNTPVVYDAKSFELVDRFKTSSRSIPTGFPSKSLSSQHLSVNGVVVERTTGDLVALTLPSPFPLLVQPKTLSSRSPIHSYSNSAPIFGRFFSGSRLTNRSGTAIANLQGYSVQSLHAPILLSVNTIVDPKNRSGRITQLEIRNASAGEVIERRTIESIPSGTRTYDPFNFRFLHAGKKIGIFANRDQIFTFDLPTKLIEESIAPLHFQWSRFEPMGVESKVELEVKAKGGKGKVSYALLTEYPGLELDESTGTLSLDLPSIWKQYLNGSTNRSFPRIGSRTAIDPAGNYFRLTQTKLPENTEPYLLPINVAATDDEGQQDQHSFYLIVVAPTKPEKEAMAAEEKNRQEKLAEMQRIREAQIAAAKKQRDEIAKQRSEAELKMKNRNEERIEELEKRVRRMEATLDTILRKLEELGK